MLALLHLNDRQIVVDAGQNIGIAGVLQRAPQRYYQRPDAPQVTFDPDRTSLNGWAGRMNLNRNGGVWRVSASTMLRTSGSAMPWRAGVVGR